MLHVGFETLLLFVSLSSFVAASHENCYPYDAWRNERDERSQKLVCAYLYTVENCTDSWVRLYAGQRAEKVDLGAESWFWRDSNGRMELFSSGGESLFWREATGREDLVGSGRGSFQKGQPRTGKVRPGCTLRLYESVDTSAIPFIDKEIVLFYGW